MIIAVIIKIGGDFMSGRFFTLPLFISVAIISRYNFHTKYWIFLFTLVIFAGLFANQIPLLSDSTYGENRIGIVNSHGISDERRAYYPHVGLLKSFGEDKWPDHRWALSGSKARNATEILIKNNASKKVLYPYLCPAYFKTSGCLTSQI